jgi:hypothetical protein
MMGILSSRKLQVPRLRVYDVRNYNVAARSFCFIDAVIPVGNGPLFWHTPSIQSQNLLCLITLGSFRPKVDIANTKEVVCAHTHKKFMHFLFIIKKFNTTTLLPQKYRLKFLSARHQSTVWRCIPVREWKTFSLARCQA